MTQSVKLIPRSFRLSRWIWGVLHYLIHLQCDFGCTSFSVTVRYGWQIFKTTHLEMCLFSPFSFLTSPFALSSSSLATLTGSISPPSGMATMLGEGLSLLGGGRSGEGDFLLISWRRLVQCMFEVKDVQCKVDYSRLYNAVRRPT